jgi:DNA-binding response OmpR family regulator
MVVEDDVEMNQLQRELLAVHGLDAIPAYTGNEAVELYQHTHADAILLDVMLPEMDGFETCRRIRTSNHNPGRMPIVMVTALDSDDCRRRGYEAGADAYFAKPFDPDEVIAMIQTLLAKATHA